MRKFTSLLVLIGAIFFSFSILSNAQTVSVGKGSYSTSRKSGQDGPSSSDGKPAFPKVSSGFNQPVQSNDFWSSLIFARTNNRHTNNIFAHPLNLRASSTGLELGYSDLPNVNSTEYQYPFTSHLRVGVLGLTTSETLTDAYGDWTVTALWENGSTSIKATFGHGLPYVFFTVSGGNAVITSLQGVQIWHNVNEVLGITLNGIHYGIFAPSGSTWTGTSTFSSSLNGQNYFSIAVLPDANSETLELFRKHAYAFVKNSSVDWVYDEANAKVTTTFTYETELKDASSGNLNETMSALYRHQWMHTTNTLTNYTYKSPRGTMKVVEGNSFSTEMNFSGILPTLPDVGDYNRIELLGHVQDVAKESLNSGSTYENGKAMGRFAQLVHVADQLGAVTEKEYLLSELKKRLEEWLTAGGEQEYVYDSTWDALTGYPSGYGADRELNDHHFHHSYAILSAATIAQFDKDWARQENWGGMINLLIRDANNWKKDDSDLPFLRNFDAYAGHGWAAGHADFPNGNNQESSSESINFATATFLWGEVTNQAEIRDLGVFLHTTEALAIDQYWFDVDNETFPQSFSKNALGMVWSSGGLHDTWFGSRPEFIHGINFLPINGGSLYLGKHPEYILENYNSMLNDIGGNPTVWKDIFWKYIALSDANLALSLYKADLNYQPFDGETRASTQHWLFNIQKMGRINSSVFADISSYAVFVDRSNDTTYVAYNSGETERLVTFTDGFSMTVPANTLHSFRTVHNENAIDPAPVPTMNSANVISIFSDTYPSVQGTKFDLNEGQNTVTSIQMLQGNNALKYENLDFQTTVLGSLQNVASRTSLHIDYWTDNSTALQIFLISNTNAEEKADITVITNAWQSLDIPLSTFSETVDLTRLAKIKFVGNGTVYIDNIYFGGENPIPDGPYTATENPETDPSRVISIFSDVYENISGVELNPNWGQETVTTVEKIDGNNVLKYSELNYQGTDFRSKVDVSNMYALQFDYWTDNTTNLEMYLVSPGPLEKPYEIAVERNYWQRVIIPLSAFSDVVNLEEARQLKVVGNGTVYIDNIIFWSKGSSGDAPTTAAADPETNPSDVISIFSDAYENISSVDLNPFWSQATVATVEQIAGNNILKYSGLNYQGTDFGTTVDVTGMQWFQFDYWTVTTTNLQMFLISPGPKEKAFNISVATDLWKTISIPLSTYSDVVKLDEVFQLKVVGDGTLYLDNIYFGREGTTSISEKDENEIPSSLELNQNYPNPFNPSTVINFSIPTTSQVNLSVYNSLGQQVATLVNSIRSPGKYTATWNASNAPSGVYFYLLKTYKAQLTKQMLLIK